MSDDHTRCATLLVFAGRLELLPDILAELGEQKNLDREARLST
ncbi:hypothetical protein [Burkholderia cenocepacia]